MKVNTIHLVRESRSYNHGCSLKSTVLAATYLDLFLVPSNHRKFNKKNGHWVRYLAECLHYLGIKKVKDLEWFRILQTLRKKRCNKNL